MRELGIVVAALVAGCAPAPPVAGTPVSTKVACRTRMTRAAEDHFKLRMHRPDGVAMTTVTLARGERLCLVGSDDLRQIHIVDQSPMPALSVELSRTSAGITLVVDNYLSRPLRYSAAVTIDGQRFPEETCPVEPRQVGVESYDDDVTTTSVYAFELLPSGSRDRRCLTAGEDTRQLPHDSRLWARIKELK